ncbi:MAG: 3-dehydroquinate synthase [Magnetococcales bacterium]|nr:3-dehydroquinate synthase [Magnetococcales bacterium]
MSPISHTLTVALGDRSYDILIGTGILPMLGAECRKRLKCQRIGVVSNETVAPLHLDRTRDSLEQAGFAVTPIILPDGESHKNWLTLQKIFDALIEHRFERGDLLLALGGGVIGDMTGFAAACYQRGVAFVQVPTTLLAQVDASVGGKTGINHPLGKNLIGAFHQPTLVLMDVATLETLPEREFRAGLAEVIKYGILWDREMFAQIETHLEAILARDPAWLIALLRRSCEIKAEIVAMDEREHGARALLNLGHTFGHAIESLTGYDTWLHGEAVAAGTVAACHLAERIGICSPQDSRRIQTLIKNSGLPTRLPDYPIDHYLAAMIHDKKVAQGKIRLVLPEGIGRSVVRGDVTQADLAAALTTGME